MEDVEAKLRGLAARDRSHGALSALPPEAMLAQALADLPPAWVSAALDLYCLPAAETADEGRAALARLLQMEPVQALRRALACAPRPGLQHLLARLAKADGHLHLKALDEFRPDRAADTIFAAGDRPASASVMRGLQASPISAGCGRAAPSARWSASPWNFGTRSRPDRRGGPRRPLRLRATHRPSARPASRDGHMSTRGEGSGSLRDGYRPLRRLTDDDLWRRMTAPRSRRRSALDVASLADAAWG